MSEAAKPCLERIASLVEKLVAAFEAENLKMIQRQPGLDAVSILVARGHLPNNVTVMPLLFCS